MIVSFDIAIIRFACMKTVLNKGGVTPSEAREPHTMLPSDTQTKRKLETPENDESDQKNKKLKAG